MKYFTIFSIKRKQCYVRITSSEDLRFLKLDSSRLPGEHSVNVAQPKVQEGTLEAGNNSKPYDNTIVIMKSEKQNPFMCPFTGFETNPKGAVHHGRSATDPSDLRISQMDNRYLTKRSV